MLGRDGLLIDGHALAGLDTENIAAVVPPILDATAHFSVMAARGDLVTAVLEHTNGLALVSVLSPDAVLLVLVQPTANVGDLLFELRRNREHLAALV